MSRYVILLVAVLLVICHSCTKIEGSGKPVVTVTLPVESFFVKSIADTLVDVNVMIPVTAGHSTYTPLPSQLRSLSRSDLYLAIGSLDFELAWKEKMLNVAGDGNLRWVDMDRDVESCYGSHCHHDEGEGHDGEELSKDPHYWVSPRQAMHLVENMGIELADYGRISTAEVRNTIEKFDEELKNCTAKAFMIYHPALTYLARDYGMEQLTIEQEGKSISPRDYARQIEKAKELGVKVIFCQQGYDTERVKSAANDLGARIVEIQPESDDYVGQMTTIIEALR
ncbi:MAG: zinc ABC transporter substrate-binding protein [Bacteroidales bacterium]|nr:zinc ABC transporter substrate-binding protein [Bacteroidales bacterium]